MNSSMNSEYWFHVLLMVSNRNKQNRWQPNAYPNSLALKRDMSSVQVVDNIDQSKDNAWLRIISGNESRGIQIGPGYLKPCA